MLLELQAPATRAFLLIAMALITPGARAGEGKLEKDISSLVATNYPGLQVEVRQQPETTHIRNRYAFVTQAGRRYTFLIPDDLGVDSTKPDVIKLASRDYTCLITAHVITEQPTLELAVGRTQVEYPGANITSKQLTQVSGRTVPQLDFVWKGNSGVARQARTISVAGAGGQMEFTLLASPERFEAVVYQLNLVVASFRASADGKFDYVVGSKYP